MINRRETVIQRLNGERIEVVTDEHGTRVKATEGEVLLKRAGSHHNDWIRLFTRDGSQVVSSTGTH